MKLFASQPLQYIPSFCKDTVNSWMMSKSLTLAEIFTFIWKRKLSACFNAEIVFQWLVVCNHTTLSPCARAPICSRQCLLIQERISVWLKQTFLTASNFPSSFKFPGFLLLQLVNNCSYGPAGRAGCWQWGGCPALQLGGQRSSPETSYWQVSSNSQAHSHQLIWKKASCPKWWFFSGSGWLMPILRLSILLWARRRLVSGGRWQVWIGSINQSHKWPSHTDACTKAKYVLFPSPSCKIIILLFRGLMIWNWMSFYGQC